MKAWLPQVGLCLLLQAGIATTAVALRDWLAVPAPAGDKQLLL